MAEFSDDFARADEAIEDSGWAGLNSNNATTSVVEVSLGRAVNADPTYSAAAFYATTKPTTVDQEMAANVVSSTQGTNCYVDVGVLGKEAAAGWSSNPLGVWARLSWLANGARRLSLHRFLPGDSAASQVASADVVYAGSIENPNYRGALLDSGALDAEQNVRVVVQAAAWGLRARAYLNTADDDRWILEGRITTDWPGTGDIAQADGSWWIGFGPSAGTAGDQAVLAVSGFDYDQTDDKELVQQRDDQPLLGEIRQEVLNRYTNSGGTNRPDPVVDQAIERALQELVLILGDKFPLRQQEETLSLTIDPVTSVVTAGITAKMQRVLEVRWAVTNKPVFFRQMGSTTDGAPVVWMDAFSDSYIVRYATRLIMPKAKDDPLPIPKEYGECIVYGACQRMAEGDGKHDLAATWKQSKVEAMRLVSVDVARSVNLERTVQRPARIGPLEVRRRSYANNRIWW